MDGGKVLGVAGLSSKSNRGRIALSGLYRPAGLRFVPIADQGFQQRPLKVRLVVTVGRGVAVGTPDERVRVPSGAVGLGEF